MNTQDMKCPNALLRIGDVNVPAFALALLFAPSLVAALTFWAYFIPVLALFWGWVPYLVFGGPALFLFLLVFPANPFLTALLLFCVNWLAFDPSFDLARELGMQISPKTAEFNLQFGSVFAPLWGFAFGVIYTLFDRAS